MLQLSARRALRTGLLDKVNNKEGIIIPHSVDKHIYYGHSQRTHERLGKGKALGRAWRLPRTSRRTKFGTRMVLREFHVRLIPLPGSMNGDHPGQPLPLHGFPGLEVMTGVIRLRELVTRITKETLRAQVPLETTPSIRYGDAGAESVASFARRSQNQRQRTRDATGTATNTGEAPRLPDPLVQTEEARMTPGLTELRTRPTVLFGEQTNLEGNWISRRHEICDLGDLSKKRKIRKT